MPGRSPRAPRNEGRRLAGAASVSSPARSCGSLRTASSSELGRTVVGGAVVAGAELAAGAEVVADPSGPVAGDPPSLRRGGVIGERAALVAGTATVIGGPATAVTTTGATAVPVPTRTGVVANTATAVTTDAVMSPPAMSRPRRA